MAQLGLNCFANKTKKVKKENNKYFTLFMFYCRNILSIFCVSTYM